MKFKKGDRVECLYDYHGAFTKGKIYTVRENELDEHRHLTIELDDNGSKTNGWKPKYFKLIEENKMKTSKEMQLKILDKMKSNIDNNLPMCSGIEYYSYRTQKWHTPEAIDFENLEYRLKPETIALKNGVTIPKPLDVDSIDNDKFYYYPCVDRDYFDRADGRRIKDSGTILFYASMNEAREAGKALFGIE